MSEQCYRKTCLQPAETQITLRNGTREKTYDFCMDHYLEVLTLTEMMRRLTGMPKIFTEQGTYNEET